GKLITFHHVVALDEGAFLLTHILLFEARAAALVQQVEGNRIRGGRRGVELHRDGNQSEGDGQRSNRARRGHGTPAVVAAPPYRARPKVRERLYLLDSTSCHRSPVFSNRAGTVASVKSITSAASSSSQVSGIETGAPGSPRGE